MPLKDVVAKNIKSLRIQKGLTQDALAKLTGWQPTYVNRIERNPQNLSLESLELLSKALDVPSAQLLAEEGLPFPTDFALQQFNQACDLLQSVRDQAHLRPSK